MGKSVGVILAAAGQARRMGMGSNKAYLNLQGRPILAYSLQFFAVRSEVTKIIVVTSEAEAEVCRELVAQIPLAAAKTLVVTGGKERQDSVACGLAVMPEDIELIAVHDAARPLLQADLFNRLLLESAPGVIPAISVVDTIKLVSSEGKVKGTLPREEMVMIQTPQIFTAQILRECYARAQKEGFYGTDDASLLERYQYPVQIVLGEKYNLKITTPLDLALAEFWLEQLKGGDQD